MLERRIIDQIRKGLRRQAAVALIGPRQVGKTTLARTIAAKQDGLYLDLESPQDRAKLADPELFLQQYTDRLVILDGIHRVPELFQPLRGIIDDGRRENKGTCRFLLLGSASMDLLKQSGESLAGRIEYVEMNPLDCLEVSDDKISRMRLWVRGGFPDSYLAKNDEDSFAYRSNFICTYLERDVPQFGPRIPAETLERLWTMLAYSQGGLLNAAKLGASLSLTGRTISNYIDLLSDLLMVRRLPAWHANTKKRLVKSPRVYVRDSGLVHALLGLETFDRLAGNPVLGASWEGFVIENLLALAPDRTHAGFYRTSAGAEIDLILHLPGQRKPWAIEIKYGLSPKPSRGFHQAIEDLEIEKAFVVYSGDERFPLSKSTEAISLRELSTELQRI
jgi:predicted AAA+ superfamily ATPase